MAAEIGAVDALRKQLLHNAEHANPKRLLAVMTVAHTSERYLGVTLPMLMRQAAAAGLHADVIVGLDSGYRCDDVLNAVSTRTGAPLTISDVACPQAAGLTTSATSGHRLIAVARPADPQGGQKTRNLRYLVTQLVMPALAAGWQAPRWTLLLDAESLFASRADDPEVAGELAAAKAVLAGGPPSADALRALLDHGVTAPPSPFDPRTPALARLLRIAEQDNLDLVGASTRFTAFEPRAHLSGLPVWLPALGAPIASPYQVYNLACGVIQGCHCLPGAGTLARTSVLIPLLAVVLERHHDIYGEDALVTMLASLCGHSLRLERCVQVTNRCPARTDTGAGGAPAWPEQFRLWYQGFADIADRYGAGAARPVVGPSAADARAVGLLLGARAAVQSGRFTEGLAELDRFADSARLLDRIAPVVDVGGRI